MANTVKQYAEALQLAISESRPEDADTVVDNLIALLKDNNDLEKYEEIVAAYEELVTDAASVKDVEVTVAREAVANSKLLDELNTVFGGELEVRTKVDDEIIGGVVVRVDDELIDASVKSQLERIKNQLSE